jgi:hypothetical protein
MRHEKTKKAIRLTREEKEIIKTHFSSFELWDTVKPTDFKRDIVEYITWLR